MNANNISLEWLDNDIVFSRSSKLSGNACVWNSRDGVGGNSLRNGHENADK